MIHLLSILTANIVSTTTQTVETEFFTGLLGYLLLPWVFYLILTIAVIGLIILHENKEIGWSHTVFLLLVAYLCFKFDMKYKDILYNPFPILKYIGLYLILGIIWSFCKWFFFLKSVLLEFNKNKNQAKFESENNTILINNRQSADEILKELINENLYNKYYRYSNNSIKIKKGSVLKSLEVLSKNNKNFEIYSYTIENPQANNHKALITTWITHWPVSLVWTLINDPIKKFINHIFEFIKSVFQSISDKVFKSVKADL